MCLLQFLLNEPVLPSDCLSNTSAAAAASEGASNIQFDPRRLDTHSTANTRAGCQGVQNTPEARAQKNALRVGTTSREADANIECDCMLMEPLSPDASNNCQLQQALRCVTSQHSMRCPIRRHARLQTT